MRKALAAIAAIAMVVGAYIVRTEVIQPDGNGSSVEVGTSTDASADTTVACDSRLGGACPAGADRMGVADMITTFAAADAAYDLVVAPQSTIDMIAESGRSRVTFGSPVVLATSPVVLVTATAATATLDQVCPAPPTWECVSSAIQAGQVMPSLPNPTTTSDGIAALAALAGGYFEAADAPFNLNGFNTGGFIGWLDALQQEAVVSPSGVENIIRFSGAQNDSALVTEATALDVTERAARDDLALLYPQPNVVLAVVVVAIEGGDTGDLDQVGDTVGQALQAAGWRGPDGVSATDAVAVAPQDDGLPSGGVMVALQQRWR